MRKASQPLLTLKIEEKALGQGVQVASRNIKKHRTRCYSDATATRSCRRGLRSAITLILACWDLCQI